MDERNLYDKAVYDITLAEKSPFIQGLISGTKGLLIGGLAGGAVNAFRAKSPLTGALIGGLGTGVLMGLARAASQETENANRDAALRYHLMRISDKEPTIFLPPPQTFGPLLHRLLKQERAAGAQG